MASLISLSGGKRRVQFVDPDGKRCTLHLGTVDLRHAERVHVRVEALLSALITREAPDRATCLWLDEIGDDLHRKLAAVGLVKPRVSRTLGAWFDAFMESRSGLKPESLRKLGQTRVKLEAFFGESKPLYEITPDDASRWREYLKRQGLSEAAVKTHCGNAKTIFADAVRRELLARSPFAHLRGGVTPTRNTRYVTPGETERVLAACPDAQWRLLVGLARLAGLRTPSETHLLTWADVDFAGARLRVRSPKTERHAGHEQRIVPITPRLMELLQERFDEAEEGETHLIAIRGVSGRRRKMVAIMHRAKVEVWAGTWQTLRRSCEIEWAQLYPQYAVSRWIGHSITVSGRHYANNIPDELYARVSGKAGCAGVPAAAPAGRAARSVASNSAPWTEPHVTQNTTQHPAASAGTIRQIA